MSDSKKKQKTSSNTGKKEINPLYYIGIGVALIIVVLVVFLPGYMKAPDEVITSNSTSAYFGKLESISSRGEVEAHVSAFIAENAGISDACEISHFYNYDCGACQRLEPWIIGFKSKYPDIQITSYELHEISSREKFEGLKQEYGLDAVSVPSVFICGSVLVGVDPIETNLEPMALAVYDLEPREEIQVPIVPLELSL